MLNINCVPSQYNPKLVTWKSASLGADIALFDIPSWAYQPMHLFQQSW